MSWDDIYRKWGLSEEAITGLNAVTWLAFGVAVIIGGLLILGTGIKAVQWWKADDEKTKKQYRKETLLKALYAILCFLVGSIWPIILGTMDAFGVGKITSGDFLPETFNLVIQKLGVINIKW